MVNKKSVLREFQLIPGVGPSIANNLYSLGFRSLQELATQNPEQMYKRQCALEQAHIDKCLLYVFREIVYFAAHKTHNKELLKWWNWKDKK